MNRMLGVAVVGLLAVSAARGHFPFIVPEGKGDAAKVVFSDDLNPDPNVAIEKLENTKLVVRDAAGKECGGVEEGDAFYSLPVPVAGTRVVYGTTDYGVLQKGDAPPFKLTYYPKAVIGAATAKEATVGEKLPLEVTAEGAAGKLRFRVLAAGKPVPGSEVTVMLPGSGKKAVTTDKEGYTPEFAETGRFGVVAKLVEAKPGEHGGKKYSEARHYATLVCDIGQ